MPQMFLWHVEWILPLGFDKPVLLCAVLKNLFSRCNREAEIFFNRCLWFNETDSNMSYVFLSAHGLYGLGITVFVGRSGGFGDVLGIGMLQLVA
jgi:hypothetical protein